MTKQELAIKKQWQETGGGNITLKIDGVELSYNPCVRPSVFDRFMDSAGKEETAFNTDRGWCVLNGDHRKELEKAARKGGIEDCIDYYTMMENKHGSEFSTYE